MSFITYYSLAPVHGLATVNQTTAGPQSANEQALFANGSGVVTWTSGIEVYVRLLDTEGRPVGNELLVDGTGARPDVTVLANGNFVVTWQDGYNISARIYSPQLQPVSTSITALTGSQAQPYSEPDTKATPDGGFVVSASYDLGNGDIDIYTKKFNSAGAQLASSAVAPSRPDTNGDIAVTPNGNVAVLFAHGRSDGNDDLWAEIYSPSLANVSSQHLLFSTPAGARLVENTIVANPDNSFTIITSYDYGTYELYKYGTMSISGAYTEGHVLAINYDTDDIDADWSVAGNLAVATIQQDSSGEDNDIRVYLAGPDGLGDDNRYAMLALSGEHVSPELGWVNAYTIQLTMTAIGNAQGSDGSDSSTTTGRFSVIANSIGDESADNMVGGVYLDLMIGNGGNDTMDGASGSDTMIGGAGNDVYSVDSAGDIVDEVTAGSGGFDTVNSWISYTLASNVDALVLLGGSNLTGTGNALGNDLQGNSGNNWLDGSFGADTMRGYGGNDSYVVDNDGDFVDELQPGSTGWDTIYTSLDYTLGPNLEALVLIGNSGIDGTGNGLANYLQGNGKANVLKGGSGSDTVRSGAGKDTMDGGSGKDAADYRDTLTAVSITLNGSGLVTVKIGGKSADKLKNFEDLFGGSKSDRLGGDSKANNLDGGFGKDLLTGAGGKDKFVFSTALTKSNIDTITDFKHGQDKVLLDDAIFWSLGPKLDKAEFYSKAGATKAHDADDRIVYDSKSGKLYYDDDGKGGHAALHFATLSGHPSLSHSDFSIV